MQKFIQFGSNVFEYHYPGEPYSLDKNEKTPHLQEIVRYYRNILGSGATGKYLSDIKLQNKQFFDNLILFINSSMFNRVKITNEYYLLTNLFKDPSEKARWIQFINDLLMKERQQLHLKQQETPKIIKIGYTSTPSLLNQQRYTWSHPDPNLSNMEKWQYYKKELDHISYNYNQQKIQAYSASIDRNISRVDRVLEQLDKNHSKYNKIKSIRNKYLKRKEEILSRNLKSDGTFDKDVLFKKEQEINLLQSEMNNALLEVFNSTDDPIFIDALKEQLNESFLLDSDLEQKGRAFEEERSKLVKEIQEVCFLSKKETGEEIQKIIHMLNVTDFDELSDSQKNSFAQLQDHLNTYQEQLLGIKDPDEYQEVLRQMSRTIQKDASYLPSSLKDKIIPIAEQLGKTDVMHESFRTEIFHENNLNQDKVLEKKQSALVENSLFDAQRNYKTQINGIRESNKKETSDMNMDSGVNDLCKEVIEQITFLRKDQILSIEDELTLKGIEEIVSNNPDECLGKLYQKINEASEIISNSEDLLEKIEFIQENKNATPSV